MHQNVPKGRFQGTPASMPEISATTTGKLLLVVGGALIKRPEKGGRSLLLLAQRPPGKANAGLWELPGGKLDEGETPEGALVRELREELGLEVELKALEPLSFVSYPYPTFHLLMPVYAIHSWAGTPRGAEGQQIAFVNADEISQYTLTPADIPLLPHVLRAMQEAEENAGQP